MGTQPTLTQVPPRGRPSLIITVSALTSAATVAAAKAAAPPPRITRSNFSISTSQNFVQLLCITLIARRAEVHVADDPSLIKDIGSIEGPYLEPQGHLTIGPI